MSKTFQVEAIVEGTSPLKDGGMSIRFHTQEIKPVNKIALFNFYQKFGWLQFSANQDMEAPKEEAKRESGQKSQSTRLRNVLYVEWSQSGSDSTFDEYYQREMEKIINTRKENLH